MKKNYFFTFILTLCFSAISFAQTLFIAETFDYDDGTTLISTDGWANFSGAEGQILVNSGEIQLKDTDAEDADNNFPDGPVTGDVYYAFDITVTKPASVSGSDFEYFALLRPVGSTSYKARLDVAEFTETGFKFGIHSNSSTAEVLWGSELSYTETHRIVVRYSTTVGDTQLWVNASDDSSASIITTTTSTIADIGAFAFRQSGSSPDFIHTIDNLAVGSAFDDVLNFPATSTTPSEAAPTPPARETSDVVSLFSDAYTDVTLTELPTDWSDVTTFEATTVAGDNVWKLSGLEFLGMVTNYDTGIDVSTMEKLHIDYWVPTGVENELIVKIVNTIDGGEDLESLGTTVSGSWQSIDLDMSGFDGGNLANTEKITQILFDAVERATTVYVDNFYFYKEPVVITEPTEAAPTPPARETSDVVSLFSDAYTDVTLTELPTDWSDVTTFEATTVAGDNVWKLSGLEFLGMVTNYDTGIDVSTMEKLHIDYWVPTGVENELIVKIVNTIDGGEDLESLGTTVSGSWQSIDLDMSGFDGGNLANTEKITQILFDAVERATTVYVDNFYFYKEPTAGIDDQDLVSLNMYPNPASDVLNISAQSTINSVEIFNVLGQKVIRMNVEDTSAEINVSNLNAGIYLIKYEINNRTSTKKFVKN